MGWNDQGDRKEIIGKTFKVIDHKIYPREKLSQEHREVQIRKYTAALLV